MSIIDEGSVLLLGAGSSKPFGLPLGDDLMEEIPGKIECAKGSDWCIESNSTEENITYTALTTDDGKLKIDDYILKKSYIVNLIRNQTSESIDDFIRENYSYAVICKRAVSTNLFFKLYEREGAMYRLKSFESRKTYPDREQRNWIHLLINIVRQGVRDKNFVGGRKIRIITFNYETILEYVLEKQFANTEALEGKKWNEFIEIVHPHGSFGTLAETQPQSDAVNTIIEWANRICVVNDDEAAIPDAVKRDRELAREWVRKAKRIYVAGFAFAGPNCRLLNFAAPGEGLNDLLEVDYLNYDGNAGVEIGANRLAYAGGSEDRRKVTVRATPYPGSPDKPISIANWIKSGAIGELPG